MKTFDIPLKYKSPVISKIKTARKLKDKLKKDFSPTTLRFDPVTILIARHFGFCYGVENAVEIAYKTVHSHQGKKVYLLSEMIHNPDVNTDLQEEGVEFLMNTDGQRIVDFDKLSAEDIVIVPAFGTTLEMQAELSARGIDPYKYDTTCPFVEKVWNRAQQIGQKGYTVVVHGKPNHEETRATFSHSISNAPTVIVKDLQEAHELAKYIRKEKSKEEFYQQFKGRFSEGFDPEIHLIKLGVVNQTTMLATETQEIANYLREELVRYYQLKQDNLQGHFANTKDTLCYATNDNQEATHALIHADADIAVVVGGYNSSNTTHIVELLDQKMPTFFIKSAECIESKTQVSYFDIHSKQEVRSAQFIPAGVSPRIILTCGASCPDAIVEEVLNRILQLFNQEENLQSSVEKSLSLI